MKNLSREFRQKLDRNERDYLVEATITLQDNTVLNLTNSEIWSNGFSYEEAVSNDDNFDALGSAVIGSAILIINNIYETYSPYDFTNANVIIYLGMDLNEHEEDEFDEDTEDEEDEYVPRIEKFRIGTYIVDETNYNGGTIRLSLLDNMEKFDRPYITSLTYPATLKNIVRDACYNCLGSENYLATQDFPHGTYTIQTKPDENTTFREVISWVATIAGCFVKCNPFGELELKWFDTITLNNTFENYIDGGTFNPWNNDTNIDGGTFNPWNTGDIIDGGTFYENDTVHRITDLFSQNISMDDVVITEVVAEVKVESESSGQDIISYSIGTSGYTIKITDNPFITTDNAQTIVNWLGAQLLGIRFRKLSVSQASDPSVESGDIAVVIDRKQNIYRALVTRVSFTVSGNQTIVCGAETPSRNNATRFTAQTKSYTEARKLVRQEMTLREAAIQALSNRISGSAGLYTTIVPQQTGGNIYYMHDKSTLAGSKVVWKMTADVWLVTDDWQGTDEATTAANKWNGGMAVNGDVITRILTANGINADWINTGAFTVRDANGNITFQADADTGSVQIKASNIPHQFFGEGVPTVANYPANQWNTEALKAFHAGDLYTDTVSKKTYQYVRGYAGSKIKFASNCVTESVSYDYLIIYFEFDGKYYKYPKIGGGRGTTSNTIAGAEFFIPATEYYIQWKTDSSVTDYGWAVDSVTSAFVEDFPSSATVASALPTGVTEITAQTTTPQSPHPYESGVNELWTVQTGNNAGEGYSWVSVVGVDADSIFDTLTQQAVFDKLTNNGTAEGIYLENGQLYILFTYAKGGTLVLGGNQNRNGVLSVRNASDVEYASFDNNKMTIVGTIEDREYLNDPSDTSLTNYKVKIENGLIKFYNRSIYGGYIQSYVGNAIGLSVYSNGLYSIGNANTSVGANQSEVLINGQFVRFNANGVFGTSATVDPKNLTVYGNLAVWGDDKNRIVKTQNYGPRAQNAYETATPYFGDIGTGIVGENGEVIIAIDDIFSETIISYIEYVVFLQKEGSGDIWVSEKDASYFVVTGTPGLRFAWEIKSVQKGHPNTRLTDFDLMETTKINDEDVGLSMEADLKELDNEDVGLSMEADLRELDNEDLFDE